MSSDSDPQYTLCRKLDAKVLMENDELAQFYFQSGKITFVTSVLPPGSRSSLDPGHEGAHEVAYCVSGEMVVEIGEGNGEFVRLLAGDAVLIHEGVPHTVFNPGSERTEMVWASAPSLGRPLVYNTPEEG